MDALRRISASKPVLAGIVVGLRIVFFLFHFNSTSWHLNPLVP
jgi:hypothetical protein